MENKLTSITLNHYYLLFYLFLISYDLSISLAFFLASFVLSGRFNNKIFITEKTQKNKEVKQFTKRVQMIINTFSAF